MRRRWVSLSLSALGLVLGVGIIAAEIRLGYSLEESFVRYTPPNVVLAFTFPAIAGLILSRDRRHRVGWIMLWIGLLAPMQIVAGALAEIIAGTRPLVSAPGVVRVLAWIPSWVWVPSVFPVFLLLPYYFPSGELPSPRWRWGVRAAVGYIALLSVVFAVQGSVLLSIDDPAVTLKTLDAAAENPAIVALSTTLLSGIGVFALAAVVSVVVRFRRSVGVERQQLEWLVLGVIVTAPTLTVALLSQATTPPPLWSFVLIMVSIIPIPAAIGVAILRHRLFDIDVVVSKSLVYGGLAVFIGVLYVGVVVGVGTVIGSNDRQSLFLQILATAMVAVLFQPVRRRLERVANRLVFGRRATPYEVLSAFSRQAASALDESALPRVADLLADGTGAAYAVVWLRVGDGLQTVATSGATGGADRATVYGEDLPSLEGDLVVPVRHEGELLGALSIVKHRGEAVTPQDEDIAERLAGGLALSFSNARLTAELRQRLEELQVSRQRIVAAQDDARRRLERDLSGGARRQLEGLRAEIDDVERAAADAGASKATAVLSELADDAESALATLDDLSRGIYPPLLAAEGLPAALEAQLRKAALPVTIHHGGVDRYREDVEIAVYFCVLEAIANVVKYAQASSAYVRLETDDRELIFRVEDDGVGFDTDSTVEGTGLQGMADRLDTIGGSLDVRSRVGGGTTVEGRVPIAVAVGGPA